MSKSNWRLIQEYVGAKVDGDPGPQTAIKIMAKLGIAQPVSSGFSLSERDKQRLAEIHSDLRRVVEKAASNTTAPFVVLEGKRSLDRQRQLVARGASKTMNSRHLTGHAVDIAPIDDAGKVSWDWPLYYELEPIIKSAAADVGVSIEWGGDWRRFKDGPHWQLPWAEYPK